MTLSFACCDRSLSSSERPLCLECKRADCICEVIVGRESICWGGSAPTKTPTKFSTVFAVLLADAKIVQREKLQGVLEDNALMAPSDLLALDEEEKFELMEAIKQAGLPLGDRSKFKSLLNDGAAMSEPEVEDTPGDRAEATIEVHLEWGMAKLVVQVPGGNDDDMLLNKLFTAAEQHGPIAGQAEDYVLLFWDGDFDDWVSNASLAESTRVMLWWKGDSR